MGSRALIVFALFGTGCVTTHWEQRRDQLCYGDVCYHVGELGGGWQLVHSEGAEIGFFNRDLGGVIQANATCRDDAEASPLASLTRELMVGYTEREVVEQTLVPLAGREALRTRATAKLDGVPVQLDLYVLKRNGCIFDLSYVAPPGRYAAGAPAFGRFVAGFADERRSS